jgi:hypothetical protein
VAGGWWSFVSTETGKLKEVAGGLLVRLGYKRDRDW